MAHPSPTGRDELLGLRFTQLTAIRRLTFRVAFCWPGTFSEHALLLGALRTITSPILREFVLEGQNRAPGSFMLPSVRWRDWRTIDEFLEQRLAKHNYFKVIIRMGELYDRETLQVHAREGFPLLTSRGCVHFETSHLAVR